nr:hypothetical protein B0A51_01007 [Rachicladosporium sp. CCFEE 5018]
MSPIPLSPPRLIHALQTLLALYTAQKSYIAISNLQTYESATEKAAKYSKTIENELWKTRKTQGMGGVMVVLSLVTSTLLFLDPHFLPRWAMYTTSPALLLAHVFARKYIASYWAPSDGKNAGTRIPVPGMSEYNEASKATEGLLQGLQWLEWSWLAAAAAGGVLGYGDVTLRG